MDLATLQLSPRPNQYFIAPPGFARRSPAHADSPVFPVSPARLFAAAKAVARVEPRVAIELEDDGRLVAHYVQRSLVFRFPDDIFMECLAQGNGGSSLAMYSRSRVGYADFRVNRKRVERWLAAITRAVQP